MTVYSERNKRVTFDVPISLRDEVYSLVLPSTFSEIGRNLLRALVEFYKREGLKIAIPASLQGRMRIVVISREDYQKQKELREKEQNEN